MTSGEPLHLHVTLEGTGDLTARIYRALRSRVLDGRLRPGDRLPATRELARQLAVARGTVATAYERLVAEGFLVSRVGAGTFVADDVVVERPRRRRDPGVLRPRRDWVWEPIGSSDELSPAHDFRVGIPDASLFPFDTWRRLIVGETRLRANSPGTYAGPAGHAGLRDAVARHVGTARSVPATADDVVITNGTQQALDLVARVLLSPGDVVAVEEPGYPLARALFASLGARVVGVPVDDEGLVVARLPPQARLVYTTPSHQFPSASPCPWPVGRRSSHGRPTTRRRSSRTTTTANSVIPRGRSTPSPVSTRAAACSMSAPSPRPCSRRCGSASSSSRPRCARPSWRPASSATATDRSRRRRPSPGSWTTAVSRGTSGRRRGSMPRGTSPS